MRPHDFMKPFMNITLFLLVMVLKSILRKKKKSKKRQRRHESWHSKKEYCASDIREDFPFETLQ